MSIGNFPAGFRARCQRSGIIYFYFLPGTGIREIPLGKDPACALERYQTLQRELFISARPDGLFALDLLDQFQKCHPRPPDRHAHSRRKQESTLLRTFFTECGNPTLDSIPDLHSYQEWLGRRRDARNFDSVRLFRRIWEFMRRHEYVGGTCPWASVPSHDERVTLELADILYPYAAPELKRVLTQLLDPKTPDDVSSLDDGRRATPRPGNEPLNNLRDQLDAARCLAAEALANCHREDLLPRLSRLTVRDLTELLGSSTRTRHLPPGKIDLGIARKLVISRLHPKRLGPTGASSRAPVEDGDSGCGTA